MNRVCRLIVVGTIMAIQSASWVSAQTAMTPLDFKDITPNGMLKARAELSYRRLQEEYFQWPNLSKVNFESFPGDAIGREINALTLLSRVLHHPAPENLREIMQKLPDLQNADGYLGPELPSTRANEDVLAGHNGLACGLAEYAEWTHDPRTFEDIDRIRDNLLVPAGRAVKQYRPEAGQPADIEWHLSGGDIGQLFLVLDGATRIYKIRPSTGLKGFIETMIERYRELDVVKINGQIHSTLSAANGVLRWYEIEHRPEDLALAQHLYKQYHDLAMTETYENFNWFNRPEWTEACAVVDSFILSTNLWRVTGDVDYLADAHHILYNGVLPGQLPNGGFGVGPCVGSPDKHGILQSSTKCHREAPFCCSMRGGEGLARAIVNTYVRDGETVVLPFYADSTAILRFSDGVCTIQQKTRYPYEGRVRLEVLKSSTQKPQNFRFYIPLWVKPGSEMLRVNGQTKVVSVSNRFIALSTTLSEGDVIELTFEQTAGPAPSVYPEQRPGVTRFFQGPLLLGSAQPTDAPSRPILDLLDPASAASGEVAVLVVDPNSTPHADTHTHSPVAADLTKSGTLWRRSAPESTMPARLRSRLRSGAAKSDAVLCAVQWTESQSVAQVILQWPDDGPVPEPADIHIGWPTVDGFSEVQNPGVIGNGRQWVYTLHAGERNAVTDAVFVLIAGGYARSLPQPDVSVVGARR